MKPFGSHFDFLGHTFINMCMYANRVCECEDVKALLLEKVGSV